MELPTGGDRMAVNELLTYYGVNPGVNFWQQVKVDLYFESIGIPFRQYIVTRSMFNWN